MNKALTRSHRLNGALMAAILGFYLLVTFTAPKAANSNSYHLTVPVIIALTVTILGLWMLTCLFGFLAWLNLDSLAGRQRGSNRKPYDQMAGGIRVLTFGLLVSSIFSAGKPFFDHNAAAAALVQQINNYIIVIFPFIGFLLLRNGTKRLAVSARASMSLRAKLVTVGTPVLLLASFYVFLVATSPAADSLATQVGPVAFLALPLNILVVVGSWVLGLLATLNVERASHQGTSQTGPLAKLYNGILTMTCGFIILDALMSVGASRLTALPLSVVVALLYAFIGVVALGFALIAAGARGLLASGVSRS